MSKKLILFLMLALFGSTSFLRADDFEVQIGEGTSTTGYFPFYTLYNYSIAENLFLASELEAAGVGTGEMTSLSWYANNETGYEQQGISIWMANVTDTELTTSSHVVTGMTLVYTGSVTPAIGWNEFVLNGESFAWDGTSNLLIFCQRNNGNWNSTINWQCTAVGFNAMSYRYQDSGAYDVTVSNTMYTGVNRPNIILKGHDNAPTPPTPPTPTGDLVITPNPFELGDMPTNAWMAPYIVKIFNGGPETTIEGTLSNTSGESPFALSEPVAQTLATDETVEFNININTAAADGDYAEEFTLFYTGGAKSIITIPVTSTFYTAATPDVVEKAGTIALSYTGGEAYFTDTPVAEDLHANYVLQGMTERVKDAVYSMNLTKDSKVTINTGAGIIAVYKKVTDFHPTAEVEPIVMVEEGELVNYTLLKGNYYVIVADEDFTQIEVTVEQYQAPEALVALTPEDGASGLEGTIELTWEGGENATEYQVLFGTSPVGMPVVLDWTAVDDNYGTFDVTGLVEANTQYFWQIKARNSEGVVSTPRRGFTTALTAPNSVTAEPDEIFTDGSTLIKWKHSAGGGFVGEITVADGTETNSYIPVYGLWMDDYTRGEMIYPESMIEEMNGGDITSLTYYISSSATGPWTGDVFNVYLMEVPATTMTSYYTSANATIVYTGALDGQGTTMTINFDTPYTYTGGNLLVGIEETTCSTWKSCSFYGITATGASASGYSSSALSAVTFNQRNFLPKTTFVCGGKKEQNRGFLGFNLYYGDEKVNDELITEKQYTLSNLPYNMDGHDINVTAVFDEGESGHSTPVVLVHVSGYATLTGHVNELISGAAIAGATVNFNGQDEFGNNVHFEGTTDNNGKYTITVTAGNYNTGIATLDGMEPAGMTDPVTVAYNTTETVDFIMHELYKPVMSVYAEEMDATMSRVQWSINNEITGGGSGTGGGGTGGGDTFSVDFEDGVLPTGWTTIDADGDGYNWMFAGATMGAGYGHNGSADCVLSQSYNNSVGALNPNNYLVTPQVNVANGSTFSFFACAQDNAWAAEHFGVAVSTTTATASAFTMLQEWTMTAKEAKAPRGMNTQGNWYEYSVDLSSYAGQQIYIAIRHFNCTDYFYLDVDDITLGNGSKGDRSVQEYALYKKAILKETPITPADSVYILNTADTVYADFGWASEEPGLYLYGVSAIYPSIRTGENRMEIVYNFSDGSIPSDFNNSISSYPWTVVDGGHDGKAMKSSNGGVASSTSAISLTYNFPTAGTFSFWAECKGEGTSTFWDKCTFTMDGNQMFQCGANVTGWNEYSYEVEAGEHTFEWSYSKDSSVNPTGDYFMVDDITIAYEGGGGGGNDNPVTPITWSNILPKDMETTVTVNVSVPFGSVEGTEIKFINTNEYELGTDFTATLDETGTVTFEEFRKGEYNFSVILDGYTSEYMNTPVTIWEEKEYNVALEEILAPVTEIAVSRTGLATWTPIVPIDRIPEKYFVKLDGAYVGETTDNFYQYDEETLTVGQHVAGVAVVYTTGMSEYTYQNFNYTGCAGATHQVEGLAVDTATCVDMKVSLTWNGGTPTPPGPNPPTPPTGNTFDFESGMQGWTSLDADGDGYGWVLGSSLMGTGYGHNGSSDLVLSQSYDNNYGALNPNNYLVSPQGQYTGISFYACAQDNAWAAEHFGVAVSTTTATASAFTMLQEWTMTAKEAKAPRGMNTQGNWYEYTVDLSAYAGQTIYVAIRHFNCTDYFYLDVDDITLGEPTKALAAGTLAAAGTGFGMSNNAMTKDGNWYYYDNGTNSDAIGLTSGGSFYWGVMFPASMYEGNRLTKIAYFDYTAHTGTILIYQGGTSAPGTQIYSQPYSVSGTSQYIEIEMTEPVELDEDENVWVVMHNDNGQYVAAIDGSAGVNYGSCLSMDGTTWYLTVNQAASSLDGNWNLRAYIESGSGPAPTSIVPNKYNIFADGELVGATPNTTFLYECPDYDEHIYTVYWVDSDYTMSCEIEGVPYEIHHTGMIEEAIVNAIYPNPTSGDLHINAQDMTRISIVNTLGQVVYEQNVNADQIVVDMAKFEAGVYMVNIFTENGSSVKRVTVVK